MGLIGVRGRQFGLLLLTRILCFRFTFVDVVKEIDKHVALIIVANAVPFAQVIP